MVTEPQMLPCHVTSQGAEQGLRGRVIARTPTLHVLPYCLTPFLSAAPALFADKKTGSERKEAGPGRTVRGKLTGLKAKPELSG